MLKKIDMAIGGLAGGMILVGGAFLIMQNIFIKSYQIAGLVDTAKEARKAAKREAK